jgi:hypothetical protein
MYKYWQFKQIADKMEANGIKKLKYEAASSVAKGAHRSLFAILRDDDQHKLVLFDWSYKSAIEARTKWLLQMRLKKRAKGCLS